jgi:hypothetical protein
LSLVSISPSNILLFLFFHIVQDVIAIIVLYMSYPRGSLARPTARVPSFISLVPLTWNNTGASSPFHSIPCSAHLQVVKGIYSSPPDSSGSPVIESSPGPGVVAWKQHKQTAAFNLLPTDRRYLSSQALLVS